MEHQVRARKQRTNLVEVEQSRFAQLGPRIDELPKTGRQIVDDAHARATLEQGVDQVAADEAGPARNHDRARLETSRHSPAPSYHGRRAANSRPAENQGTRANSRDSAYASRLPSVSRPL